MAALLRSSADDSIAKQLFARSYSGGSGEYGSGCVGICLLVTNEFLGFAVKQQPWLSELSCSGDCAGTILVQPRSVETPPFALEYSQVLVIRIAVLA